MKSKVIFKDYVDGQYFGHHGLFHSWLKLPEYKSLTEEPIFRRLSHWIKSLIIKSFVPNKVPLMKSNVIFKNYAAGQNFGLYRPIQISDISGPFVQISTSTNVQNLS